MADAKVAAMRAILAGMKKSLEDIELMAEREGYRETAKRVYDARLRLSEAVSALPEGDGNG
jgi:GTP cyclohydrolase I